MGYLYLSIAIIFEVIATSSLKLSEEFTKLWPSLIVVVGYVLAFYFMTLALKTIPLGITYAIWAGMGIVLIALIGVFFFKESLDLPAIIGITLIVAGVFTINVFSKTATH